jgi:hypothetical protein
VDRMHCMGPEGSSVLVHLQLSLNIQVQMQDALLFASCGEESATHAHVG